MVNQQNRFYKGEQIMWRELKITWMMWRINRLIKQIAKLEGLTAQQVINRLITQALWQDIEDEY